MTQRRHRSGFTLAEVAVTLVVVGVALVYVLQGLNTAKITAAHTHNAKIARQLALQTLGEVESGIYQEELAFGGSGGRSMNGDYAEQGYQEWRYEVVTGEREFASSESDSQDGEGSLAWDSYADRERREQEQRERDELESQGDSSSAEEEAELAEEPYEKVRIRVEFTKLGEYENELVLERWVPWDQVYGSDDEEESIVAGASEGGAGS